MPVIIFDEPENALDMDRLDFVKQYIKGPGKTIIMITHDKELLKAADRVYAAATEKVSLEA